MKIGRLLFVLLFSCPVLFCQNSEKPQVTLLGTIHDLHFHAEIHYSLPDLRAEVEQFRPDVICGEITPESYRNTMEGYFPPEAAYLSEIASSLHARFIPADWRIAQAWQARAAKMEPPDKVKAVEEIDKKQIEGVTSFRGTSLFDYLHSQDFLSLSDRKFEDVIGENTVSDLAAGGWHERNRKIVENCLDGSEGAKRIVIVFGANHIAQLRRQLAARGITSQVATRQFTPAGLGSVPPAVLRRWSRNLQNLRGIVDGTVRVSQDSQSKVKGSSRVRDLELALKTYSPATR